MERLLWARDPPGTKADLVCPFMGFTAFKHFPVSSGSFPSRSLFAGFLMLTGISLQTLPFVARLNSSMGPGRTVVIKGEVNTNAKGSVSVSGCNNAAAAACNPAVTLSTISWGVSRANVISFIWKVRLLKPDEVRLLTTSSWRHLGFLWPDRRVAFLSTRPTLVELQGSSVRADHFY